MEANGIRNAIRAEYLQPASAFAPSPIQQQTALMWARKTRIASVICLKINSDFI
jgi:hypothetical protein